MKRKNRNILYTIFYGALIAILVLAFAALIGFEIYVWVLFGNKPITEIPAWALPFMFKSGN